jgi:outer membrane protein assembly factor BamB
MVGHDPQRTNRSPDIGPAHPRLLFTTSLIGGPALVGADGSLYGWGRDGLHALDAAGRSRWAAAVQSIEGGPPALAPNGLLFVNGLALSGRGAAQRAGMAVLAIAPNGTQRWAIHALPWAPFVQGTFYAPSGKPIPMGRSVPLSKGVAPLVTPANVLYMPFVGPGASNAGVEDIAPTGRPLRRLLPNVEPSAIAWARDGTLYELGRQGLAALTPTGALRWEQPVGATQFPGSVLVGSHGTIYASDGTAVVAFTPSGRLLWRRDSGAAVDVLAERVDGAVLAVNAAGLSAIAPQGTRLWHRALGRLPATTSSSPSIAVDALGRAYVGSADGLVRAITPDGAVLWTLHVGGPTNLGDTPSVALGPRGTLVVVGTDGHLRVYR